MRPSFDPLVALNMGLKRLAEVEGAGAARALLTAMRTERMHLPPVLQPLLCPDAYSYTTVMASLMAEGRPNEALAVWREMRAGGVVPAGASYAAAIDAHGACLQPDAALALLREMDSRDVGQPPPDGRAYRAAISACGHAGGRGGAAAVALLDEMARRGIPVPPHAFSAAIAAQKGRRGDELPALLLPLPPPPPFVFQSGRGGGGGGNMGKGGSGGKPEAHQGTGSHGPVASPQEWPEGSPGWLVALALLRRMVAAGHQPNAHAASAAVSCCAAAGRWTEALALVGLRPDGTLVGAAGGAAAAAAAGGGGAAAGGAEKNRDIAAWVCRGGRNVVSLNAAVHACAVAGKWRPALALLRTMEQDLGLEPNVVSKGGAHGISRGTGGFMPSVTTFSLPFSFRVFVLILLFSTRARVHRRSRTRRAWTRAGRRVVGRRQWVSWRPWRPRGSRPTLLPSPRRPVRACREASGPRRWHSSPGGASVAAMMVEASALAVAVILGGVMLASESAARG